MNIFTTKQAVDSDSNEYFGTPALPETVAVTMAYVPFQTDTTRYTPEAALQNGTLYAALNKPFAGGKCR